MKEEFLLLVIQTVGVFALKSCDTFADIHNIMLSVITHILAVQEMSMNTPQI